MKNRRATFGLDYIQDTVKNYVILKKEFQQGIGSNDKELLQWAYSVLEKYFNSVTENKIVQKAKDEFCKEIDTMPESVPF